MSLDTDRGECPQSHRGVIKVEGGQEAVGAPALNVPPVCTVPVWRNVPLVALLGLLAMAL